MYYEEQDYVYDRSLADIEAIREIKRKIGLYGWEALPSEEKAVYMTTGRHHLGLLYGAKGCINVSDLNRWAWGCEYARILWNSRSADLQLICLEKGLDPVEYLPYTLYMMLEGENLWVDEDSPLTFEWTMDQIPYEQSTEAYDVGRLSKDIKTVMRLAKDIIVHNSSSNDNVLNGINLSELNSIDEVLAHYDKYIDQLEEYLQSL